MTYEFKRLNILGQLSDKIDRTLRDDYAGTYLPDISRYGFIVVPDTPLNNREEKHVIDLYAAKVGFEVSFYTHDVNLQSSASLRFRNTEKAFRNTLTVKGVPDGTRVLAIHKRRF